MDFDAISRPQSVVNAVIAHMRDNGLRIGDSLPSEGAIATSIGVSRTAVREAFGAMAALHLIDIGNGRRARVGIVDGEVMALPLSHAVGTAQATVAQVWDARRALECRTAELAAINRSEAEADVIRGHAMAMRKAGDDLAVQSEHDIAFHIAIARVTRNPIYLLMIESFADLMRQTCPIGWAGRRTDDERQAVFDQHDGIAEAIAMRDPVGAAQAMTAHFDLSLRALSRSGIN